MFYMKPAKLIAILVFVFVSLGTVAQDIHFSQFYNNPLTLNPALTGRMQGSFRVGLHYRNQWFGSVDGNTAFATYAGAFDMPVRLKNADVVGAGLYVFNDASSGGRLTNLTIMASGAYHKTLGANKNHAVSLGVQVGYTQRRLDLANITFADDILDLQDLGAIDPGSSENFDDDATGAADVALGLLWNSQFGKRVNAYAGVSMFHLFEPQLSFLAEDDFRLARRITAHGGVDVRVGDNVSIIPSVIFMNMAQINYINYGIAAGFDVADETALFIGIYNRWDESVIPYVGLDLKGFRVGVSYDAVVSDLQGTNGSMEVSLSYMGRYIPIPDVVPSMYCPRF